MSTFSLTDLVEDKSNDGRIQVQGRGMPMAKALLVEPKERIRELMARVLEKEGLAVALETKATRVPDLVAKGSVDVIVMDLKLPETDGLDLLKRLKEWSLGVPVIFLEGKIASEAVRSEALRLGATVIQTEPFQVDEFLRHVRNAIMHKPRPSISGGDPLSLAGMLTKHVVSDIHDPETGRLDAKRIADYLSISLSSLAEGIGKNVAAVHKSPAAAPLQESFAPIARTIGALSFLLRSRDQVLAWLNSPHPDLGYRTPLSLILEGKAIAVAELLDAALAGQMS